MKRVLFIVLLCLLTAAFVPAQEKTDGAMHDKKETKTEIVGEMGFYSPADFKWTAGPASLPAGSQMALLEGNPAAEGPFTMRLRLPDGYRIPPHWHPRVEHVTVISGTFYLGMGEKFDEKAVREMTAGTFGFWPPEMRHFAFTKGETVLQLHGIGPWSITYVNPADDPRNKK